VRAEELRPQAERVVVGLAEAEAVVERRVVDREELVEALAAPDVAGAPAAVRGTVSAVVEEALGAGAVVPPWHEAATVEVSRWTTDGSFSWWPLRG
jgi:hypothetical protein